MKNKFNFFQNKNQKNLNLSKMDIVKGKTCPNCKRLCGNASKKCSSCSFDFTTAKEEEDPMDTESGSEGADNDPCEDD